MSLHSYYHIYSVYVHVCVCVCVCVLALDLMTLQLLVHNGYRYFTLLKNFLHLLFLLATKISILEFSHLCVVKSTIKKISFSWWWKYVSFWYIIFSCWVNTLLLFLFSWFLILICDGLLETLIILFFLLSYSFCRLLLCWNKHWFCLPSLLFLVFIFSVFLSIFMS